VVKKAALAVGSLKETEFDVRFNPDVYSPGVKHANSEGDSLKKERQLVKDAADFLLTTQIPTFVSSECNFPIWSFLTLCCFRSGTVWTTLRPPWTASLFPKPCTIGASTLGTWEKSQTCCPRFGSWNTSTRLPCQN